ncbi:IS3 family transposase [Bacillus thuringiensis]|uniref:Integrase catalytic domain-containing protein n=1 Tax=Bacillus thuringiensis subsp. jegathesan TaxID=56955 RepID=A0A9X6R0G2_BACTJ|nr:IS3 family transposase [Bacillus thuringiensis]OUB69636.1 hypothetical protein BK750_13675 [Bacillus thuringiensis serovar jegathesan]
MSVSVSDELQLFAQEIQSFVSPNTLRDLARDVGFVQRYKYETFGALQKAIDDYIHFYNNEHYQETLNGLSPLEYRVQAA